MQDITHQLLFYLLNCIYLHAVKFTIFDVNFYKVWQMHRIKATKIKIRTCVITNIFVCPFVVYSAHSSSHALSPTPETADLISVVISSNCVSPECHNNVITHYVVFWVSYLSLNIIHVLSISVCISIVYSFWLLNNIPLYGYIIICLSTNHWKNLWVVSTLGQLRIMSL